MPQYVCWHTITTNYILRIMLMPICMWAYYIFAYLLTRDDIDSWVNEHHYFARKKLILRCAVTAYAHRMARLITAHHIHALASSSLTVLTRTPYLQYITDGNIDIRKVSQSELYDSRFTSANTTPRQFYSHHAPTTIFLAIGQRKLPHVDYISVIHVSLTTVLQITTMTTHGIEIHKVIYCRREDVPAP